MLEGTECEHASHKELEYIKAVTTRSGKGAENAGGCAGKGMRGEFTGMRGVFTTWRAESSTAAGSRALRPAYGVRTFWIVEPEGTFGLEFRDWAAARAWSA